ncbi:hypothetical protein [[Limnothrix rosea] IAM M-220]|uniref:hypothetical protein n=1 Tax=[Limnothrix rosea] IAM M-220 TaxID=454133 RepID=UPI00095EF697|nr:hypothetical protein [[Limnothrix rosea] IAM M-220]OKH15910.1 hypothetical protein NIES208_12470 [[Limnothrix rosea] IAM M-220]
MSQADPQNALARLQETIAQLQAIATSLEKDNIRLSETALADLATDTAKLAAALTAPPSASTDASMAVASPSDESASTGDEWDSDIFEEVEPTPERQPKAPERQRVSQTVRRRPTRPWWQDQKVLIGAVSVAIAIIFVWKISTKPAAVTLQVTQPSSNTSPPTEVVLPEADPSQPEPSAPAPKVKPAPVEPTPTPKPEPARPLTPEQRLVAAIQRQIDDVTQPYGDNIVRAVEADFDNSLLQITVGDAWYLLREGLQDRLGSDVLELSQILDFKKLRVEDLKGNFVARNPVVGDALVIVRRYEEFQDKAQ